MTNTLSDEDNPNLSLTFITKTRSDRIIPFYERNRYRTEMKKLFEYKTRPLSDYGFQKMKRIDPNKIPWEWSQANTWIEIGEYKLFFNFSQLQKKLKHSTHFNLPPFKKGEIKTERDVFIFLAAMLNYLSPSNRLLLNVTFGEHYRKGGQNKGLTLLCYDNDCCPLVLYFKEGYKNMYYFVTCYSMDIEQMERLADSSRLQEPEMNE